MHVDGTAGNTQAIFWRIPGRRFGTGSELENLEWISIGRAISLGHLRAKKRLPNLHKLLTCPRIPNLSRSALRSAKSLGMIEFKVSQTHQAKNKFSFMMMMHIRRS
jgi:hypothetical protein